MANKAIGLGLGLSLSCIGCVGSIALGDGNDAGVDLTIWTSTSTDLAFQGGDCVGLQCQQHSCGEMASTTISGTVYDPAGRNPLYNVVVFIPNSTPKPLPSGASCDSCGSLYTGNPVVVALTDAAGRFTLENAPDGDDIPLVVQIGKWRRQFVIPKVARCAPLVLPDKMLTLPRSRTEGDIPNIAISTGSADTLECLLVRVGLSPSEYSVGGAGPGRIHIFTGSPRTGGGGGGGAVPTTSPAAPSASKALWSSAASLMPYDMVLLSCEGSETGAMNQAALHDYASAGGRVFASHFHYAWLSSGPYGAENLATWFPGSNSIGNVEASIINTFPKGKALEQWLGNVGALTNGKLPIEEARRNAEVGPAHKSSQAWIQAPNATEYFSFNTPTNAPLGDGGVPNYCGRVVYSDLHVGAASNDYGGMQAPITPGGCTSQALSAQEKALEFMLFDLSSCVVPDGQPVLPPIM